jgi:hemerythrin-like domain-containing protein
VERDILENTGRDYIEFLRSHMAIEDSDAFPRAEKALSEEDWVDVASSFEARIDPIFGPVIAEEFRDLYDYIQRES